MWTTLFLVLVFCTATLSSTPNPINVTFTSENFRNILEWSPGYGTPADTKYNVRYAIYGDSLDKRVHWRLVHHCTEISRTWCDLSVETSDLEHGYFARVRALSQKIHSKWVETPNRFDPKIDTEFGPPHVSVEVDDKYALITMEGPMRYHPDNHTPQVSMATLYPHMTYNLSIHNTRTGMIRHLTWRRNQFKYHIVDKGTEYCFSAKTKIEDRHGPSKHHSSALQCIFAPEDPLFGQVEKIVIGTAVPVALLLCSLAVGGYILHKYLSGRDQKNPHSLRNEPTFHPPPLPLPDNLNIIFISKKDLLLPNHSPELQRPRALPFVPPNRNPSVDYGVVIRNDEEEDSPDAGICQSYKQKEWQIEPESSDRACASQNSVLQTSSSALQLEFNQNQSSNVNDGENVISSIGYAAQIGCPVQPANQTDAMPDDYGIVGLPPGDDSEDMDSQDRNDEDADFLHLDWSPINRTLILPGVDLGIGQREREGRPNLQTVFVRQPSEEEALLEVEQLQFNQNQSSNVNDGENVISSMGYTAQHGCPVQPANQTDAMPDDYGIVGLPPGDDTEDMDSQDRNDEDADFLHLDWSPINRTLILPGFDLGIGQREREGRPNLQTVFVRQPSEEEALLEVEGSGNGQWETGGFLNLIVSDD